MKWFFFASFIAAILCGICWVGVIAFAVYTTRIWSMGWRGIALLLPLGFFIWGAREMFRSFKDRKSS